MLSKDWLRGLLRQNFDLWVTQFHHGRLELLLRHVAHLFYLRTSHLSLFIEKTKDASLEHADGQLVLLWSEQGLHLNLTI